MANSIAGGIHYGKVDIQGIKIRKPNIQAFEGLFFKISCVAIDDDTSYISFLDLNDKPIGIPDG
ncbi:9882_t:CDS:1, partial [Acaulospora morrowiae]